MAADVVADLTDNLDGLAGGVGEIPVFVALAAPAENTDVSLVAGIADGSIGGQALEPAEWSLRLGGFQEGWDHRHEHVGAVGHPDV
jgi:hypothetical protein